MSLITDSCYCWPTGHQALSRPQQIVFGHVYTYVLAHVDCQWLFLLNHGFVVTADSVLIECVFIS